MASIDEVEIIFNPEIHLYYEPPKRKITLEELKLPPTKTSTSIAGTVPFPLLSHEGVLAYRKSLFTSEVLDSCSHSPFSGTLILRNVARYSKFVHDFWTHPATTRIISEALETGVEPVMPVEIGHTNIQGRGENIEEIKAGLKAEPTAEAVELSLEDMNYDPLKDDAIIPWHYDSYPYVCVLMISDTTGMKGGETYMQTGDGEPIKVEGPTMGHAVVLQGGEVQHLAARAKGVVERISTITSYRSTAPGLYDSSYTSNIRGYSPLKELYPEWAQYRLAKMKEEIERMQLSIKESGVDVSKFEDFSNKQIDYLERTTAQLVPPEFHKNIFAKFGVHSYYYSSQIWTEVQKLPSFLSLVTGDRSSSWKPGSQYWMLYYKTLQHIAAGEMLESQKGHYFWKENRPYVMGDELLRQGLSELFLDWLDHTGLYELYVARTTGPS